MTIKNSSQEIHSYYEHNEKRKTFTEKINMTTFISNDDEKMQSIDSVETYSRKRKI